MPIDKTEFDRLPAEALGLQPGSHPYEVLVFLADNSEKAFTTGEVSVETDLEAAAVRTALHRLKERGLVQHKGRYWTAAPDDRLASYGAQRGQRSASVDEEYYD